MMSQQGELHILDGNEEMSHKTVPEQTEAMNLEENLQIRFHVIIRNSKIPRVGLTSNMSNQAQMNPQGVI